MLTWKEITLGKNPHLERNSTQKINRHTWKEFTLGEEAHLVKIHTWKMGTVGKFALPDDPIPDQLENWENQLVKKHTW